MELPGIRLAAAPQLIVAPHPRVAAENFSFLHACRKLTIIRHIALLAMFGSAYSQSNRGLRF